MRPFDLSLCIVSCFLIITLLLPSPTALSQTTLKVVSYNLHGMAPGSDPSTRFVHIIQNLKQLDPDIVGVQEINETWGGGGTDNQGRAIVDSLSHHFGRTYFFYSSSTHLAWDNAFLESIGIISKYPIVDSGYADLAVVDFPRKVVWSSIESPMGSVQFFNTHLSGSIAATQVRQIMQYIRVQERAHLGVASILTGDFNSTPESEAVRLLVGDGSDTTFADTFRESNPSSSGLTVPAGNASSRIDYVFYRGSGALEIKKSDVVFNTPFAPGRYCSDHYGVMTTFAELLIPRISAPASCAFPSLMPGMQFSKVIAVSNTGTESLEITSITKSNPAFQIVDLPRLPVNLTRGGPALNIGIVFTPTVAGSFVDTVIIMSNAPEKPRAQLPLRGNCVATLAPAFPGVLYAASSTPPDGFLYTIDPTTGVTTAIGPMGISGIHTLAVQPSTHELYGACTGSDSTWIYRIATQTGDAVPVFVVKAGNIRAFAFGDQDSLYGAMTTGELCRIDLARGTVTYIGTPFKHNFAGICRPPGGNMLWACLEKKVDSTFQVDPSTGEVRFVGVTGFSAYTRSLAFGPDGTLYALVDNGYNVNYIATLDTMTASGITVYPTEVNSLSAIAMSLEPAASLENKSLSGLPTGWALFQNYPNPFNPKTVIRFSVPTLSGQDGQMPALSGVEGSGASDVKLTVFDFLGREVAVLLHERIAPGTYQVEFDASGLASGTYVYRLSADLPVRQAGSFNASRTMVLIK